MSLYAGITLPGGPDLENVRRLDLLPIPMIRSCQRVGIAIDREHFYSLSSSLGREMVDLEKDISSYVPPDALHAFTARSNQIEEEEGSAQLNASSADQIRVLLFSILNVGRGRRLKTTATGKLTTGKKQLEMCRDDHPVVAKILAYRERAKLKTTYADTLPTVARLHPKSGCCPVCELAHDVGSWRVHTQFTTTRAETGRLSSKAPNLQQVPLKTKLGAQIRAGFIASPGKRLVSVDFAQIELRDLAHAAACASMIAVYQAGGDLHLDTTLRCFPVDETLAIEARYRVPAKIANFSIAYQIGARALCAHLQYTFGYLWDEGSLTEAEYRELISIWTEEECASFIERWFNARPEVRDYLDRQAYRARRYSFVWDVFGRVRRVPEVASCHSWVRDEGLRKAGNMPIQACSAGQIKLAMGELQESLSGLAQPLLSNHDQIMVECDSDVAEEVRDIMLDSFRNVMRDRDTGEHLWRVPIEADDEILERWKSD